MREEWNMRVNWRESSATRNTYAVLYAACEKAGYSLLPVRSPTQEITCYSLNSKNVFLFQDEIATADCTTIAGGPHASACYQEVAKFADYVIVGEGERALPQLLSYLEEERGEIPPGVATRDAYRPAPYSILLDAFPPFSQRKGYIEISRGCPHACAYCQTPHLFGHQMRHRSIDTIARFARRYRDVRFVSPNAFAYGSNGISPRWEKVERLLRQLEGQIYLGTFPSEVRPEFVTDQALELITTYCANVRVHFGAQSGSDRVLSLLHRGHTVLQVEDALDRICAHGLEPVVDVILGLPMETDADQQATLRLITSIVRRGRVHVHPFLPLPGTPLAQAAPRPRLPVVDRTLGRLALSGKLTGSWHTGDILL
jgi:B12-binding domain/radical SAM domain protein